MEKSKTSVEQITQAKDHINKAFMQISNAIDPDTWGCDDLSEDYKDSLQKVLMNLLYIKRKL